MPRSGSWLRQLPAVLLSTGLLCSATIAHADIQTSISGIEGPARDNIKELLSVVRLRDRKDVDEDMAHRLFNSIDTEVKTALQPFGYYKPAVKVEYKQEGNNWVYDIHVEPGPPIIITKVNISIVGPGADDKIFDTVRNQKELQVGAQLLHQAYEGVKGDMTRAAEANGYLGAYLVTNYFTVDDVDTNTAQIELQLDTGPRYHFGRVTIDQNAIRPELARRFLRFAEGDPYDRNALLRTQFALDDSLYFTTVDVQPDNPDEATLTVPIHVTAARTHWQASVGAGYGTDTQIRGTLAWTDTLLNDRGHRLRFEIKASAITRRLDARYDIPIGDPALERFSVEAINRAEQISDLDTNESTLRPSITRMLRNWQTVTSLAFTHTITDDGTNRSTQTLLVPGIAFALVPKDYLGEVLFSRTFYAELIGSHSALGSDANFLRLDLQSERNFDLSQRLHLLMRGEFGTSLVSRFSNVPGIYRFFAGGDRSVRGFAYNSLSPEQLVTTSSGPQLKKTGGRHLITGSVELDRDLPRNLGVATFFDFGNAINIFKTPLETNGNIRVHLNFAVKL